MAERADRSPGEGAALAAALHDGPLQLLGAALLRIDLCQRGPAPIDPAQLDQVAELITDAVGELKDMVRSLEAGG